MARAIDRVTRLANVACHAGGGLVVHHHHRFDLTFAVLAEFGFDDRRIHATAPIAGNEFNIEA